MVKNVDPVGLRIARLTYVMCCSLGTQAYIKRSRRLNARLSARLEKVLSARPHPAIQRESFSASSAKTCSEITRETMDRPALRKNGSQQRARLWSDASVLHSETPWQRPVWPSELKKLVARLFVLLGPTSHFEPFTTVLHQTDKSILGKEILGRIFTSARGSWLRQNPAKRFLVVALLVLKKRVSSEAF
jgi:hypothetical protein